MEEGIVTLFKSKAEKEKEARKASLDRERQKLRQFQMESASILDEAINELIATKAELEIPTGYEREPLEVLAPMADFVVALDSNSNVISIVDLEDVESQIPLDQKVQIIQGMVSSGDLLPEAVTRNALDDSTILAIGGKGLFLGAVWSGTITNVEDEITMGAFEGALEFFKERIPKKWSETETLTLYNSIRASFGKEIMDIEGLAPRLRTRRRAKTVDGASLLKEVDELLATLRAEGFSTTRLHQIKAMPPKAARNALDKFRSDLKFVRILEARFYKIDAVNFPDQGQSIFKKLSSINQLTEAAVEIEELEVLVSEWENKQMAEGIKADGFDVTVEQEPGFEDLMDGIKNMEISGYNTTFVYRQLYTGDLDAARRALLYCLANVERLRAVEDRLIDLWAEGYEERFMSIQSKLTNPAMAATAEKELHILEAVIKADSERERIFTLLRGKLESWTKEGFNVEELRNVLTKDPDTIIETFKRFSGKLNFLVKLEDDVNALEERTKNSSEFLEEFANIRRMLLDPSRTTEVMDELRCLRYLISRRGDEDAIRDIIRTKVARWWEKGYDVSVLQGYMDQPIEILEETVGEFEAFIHMLEDIEKEIDHIYAEGLEEDKQKLRSLLRDIKNVHVAKEGLKDLRAKVATAIREEDRARASGELEVGPPIKSVSLLATIILRIGHRLPVALWGKEPGDLAEELLNAEYGKTHDGEVIIKLGRKWYYGDPRKEKQFLSTYTVNVGKGQPSKR